jgi:hypothetical protein
MNNIDCIQPLFSDIDVGPKFIAPTNRQVQDWLKQTQGILSNDLRQRLSLPILKERETIVYTGPLSLSQQMYIYHELVEDAPIDN